MEDTMSTGDFKFDLGNVINEYRVMRITAEGEDLERVDKMIESCEMVDGKTFEDILNLVDTGVFNMIISGYCKKVMREVGVAEETIDKALDKLEEIYDLPAEQVAVEEIMIEVTEGE